VTYGCESLDYLILPCKTANGEFCCHDLYPLFINYRCTIATFDSAATFGLIDLKRSGCHGGGAAVECGDSLYRSERTCMISLELLYLFSDIYCSHMSCISRSVIL